MSTLEVSNLNDGTTTVATTYVTNGSAKSFNHIDTSFNIAKSFNVSSCTDETGSAPNDWTIAMTSAMDSANYVVSGLSDGVANRVNTVDFTSSSAYKCSLFKTDVPSGSTGNVASTVVHGDLA